MNVEELLRDALHAAGDAIDVPPRPVPAAARAGRRLPLVAAALAVAAAVVVAVVVADRGDDTSNVRTHRPPATVTTTTTTTVPSTDAPTTSLPARIRSLPTTTSEPLVASWAALDDQGLYLAHLAVDAAGTTIRLPDDVAGIEPGGHTVVRVPGRDDAAPDSMVLRDLRTGSDRPIGVPGRGITHAADGTGATSYVRDGAVTVAILAPETYEVRHEVVLGSSPDVPGVRSLTWDTDSRSLLVVTWDTESLMQWWRVDAEQGLSQQLEVPEGLNLSQHMTWFVNAAVSPGSYPALTGLGYGTVHVGSGRITFEKGTPYGLTLPHGTGGIEPLGRVQVQQLEDGSFTFVPGDEEAYLVWVGEPESQYVPEVLTASGRLTPLPKGVGGILLPPPEG